ncbi:MAG TPA: bifunctional 4-hydroxy-2-oxoglutarate aldolase/2-dehydro-3-deoxy-phosphogluconate aldolase [Marinilabiliales bacterium]|nr:MAG: bifunctional 4-hydroxy-2-oxoglutarate aldolase/2-dehydro-3-deoxy-phosphogluconate aldolase [Bacteroidetes bacterium GWC2_40_13]OFX72852.1 MAG: bifunctional 4-hydroxy-2-oxoglutarate aldolase/2-dehydro-3-deoxy-phosphogluconate aldolase [Bacteroidetes bacterium GWD2_40_43]OFX93545.1 MAG: bifunctional 4-hydroxy-2-oxoglutarate aldolase/2-dehydro-3-deoxy-phosphogluconate aldolase [Bacteroidetes bacterium GWE2_40_63]OFY18305.1 MAG: bifunctional 4-hydroxy-2-oxoglutarate aldolase/2-dehydro-3-deox
MARFKRLHVLNTITQTGIVPLYYHNDTELVKQVVKACYLGGARVFEFTNRGDFAHEVFAEVNKWCTVKCPEMIMGVGSVVDAGTASLYIQLGANFIVSPSLNPDMAKVCNRRKIAWMPGCATLSEINMAEELGCEIVKIFPGKEVGGPSFVKAILAPCPWTSIMPSGGVSPDRENLEAWFKAGVTCVGLGSQLTPTEVIEKGDFTFIENKVREAIEMVKSLKMKEKL